MLRAALLGDRRLSYFLWSGNCCEIYTPGGAYFVFLESYHLLFDLSCIHYFHIFTDLRYILSPELEQGSLFAQGAARTWSWLLGEVKVGDLEMVFSALHRGSLDWWHFRGLLFEVGVED